MKKLLIHILDNIINNDKCMIEFIFNQYENKEFKYYVDKEVFFSPDNILEQLLKEYKLKSIKITEYEN